MVTPRYLLWTTTSSVWPWRLYLPTSRGDPDNSALSGVEAHLPSLFRLFQSCEVFLEELSIMVVLDHLEDCAVISKQFGGRRLDHICEVINEG